MIDTLRITSPKIPMTEYEKFRKRLIFRTAVDVEAGSTIYTFVSGNLRGSWDSNISINIDLESKEYSPALRRPVKIKYDNYFTITIEFSVQKFLDGHNVGTGYDDPVKPLILLFSLIESYFQVKLPKMETWIIKRIDIGFNFILDKMGKLQFFETYSKVNYPRRRKQYYSGSGLYYAGTTTTLKIYDKGIEFRKHDYKKLLRMVPACTDEIYTVAKYADQVIRFEVEVKVKKLEDIGIHFIRDYDKNKLLEVYNKEVENIMKVKADTIVNKSDEVLDLLRHYETDRMARAVYSTWIMLATMEEEEVKIRMPERTLRRHKTIMKKYNITWINSDLENMRKELEAKKEEISYIPADFNFYYESKYRVKEIPQIINLFKTAI